jgi:hypothetical protein
MEGYREAGRFVADKISKKPGINPRHPGLNTHKYGSLGSPFAANRGAVYELLQASSQWL